MRQATRKESVELIDKAIEVFKLQTAPKVSLYRLTMGCINREYDNRNIKYSMLTDQLLRKGFDLTMSNHKVLYELDLDLIADEIEHGSIVKKLAGCNSTKTYFWRFYQLVCKDLRCYCCVFHRGFLVGIVFSLLLLAMTVLLLPK